jgi:hypothetical protein
MRRKEAIGELKAKEAAYFLKEKKTMQAVENTSSKPLQTALSGQILTKVGIPERPRTWIPARDSNPWHGRILDREIHTKRGVEPQARRFHLLSSAAF